MNRNGLTATAILLSVLSHALALAPRDVPDDELARHPVIVVGRWERAPIRAIGDDKAEAPSRFGGRTELLVERVVAGDLQPGSYPLLLEQWIGWEPEGGRVMSYTSSERRGDVEEVTKSNLWFLRRSDDGNALVLQTYRGVQPLALEPYFRALMAKDPEASVVSLLTHKDPAVVLRTLTYVHGDRWPWPYDGGSWKIPSEGHPSKRPVRADQVESLLASEQAEVRRMAMAVYASLCGEEGIPRLRKSLEDPDEEIRAIAIGHLSHRRDTLSIDAINRAAVGIREAGCACAAIQELADWGDARIVPALIAFLENDGCAGRSGDDWYIPALKASKALRKMTGYTFPFDVKASQEAWSKTGDAPDPTERKTHLRTLLGEHANPLSAGFISRSGAPSKYDILVTNRSSRPLWVSRSPDWLDIDLAEGRGFLGYGFKDPTDAHAYVQLRPGETTQVELDAERIEKITPALGKFTLVYLHNGRAFGVPGWIGSLEVGTE